MSTRSPNVSVKRLFEPCQFSALKLTQIILPYFELMYETTIHSSEFLN